MAEALMHFPTWVDLKGQDSVPDTVHHVVLNCNPKVDSAWANVRNPTPTDRVHERDRVGPGVDSPGKKTHYFYVECQVNSYCCNCCRVGG